MGCEWQGVIASSTSILGAWFGGAVKYTLVSSWHVGLAVSMLLVVFAFYVHQIEKLWRFHGRHRVHVWVPGEDPSEVSTTEYESQSTLPKLHRRGDTRL